MSFKRVSIFRYGEIETYLILANLLFKQQMLFKLFEKEQQPKQCQRLKFSRLPPREYLTFFFFFSFLKHRYIIINRPIFWICCPQSFSAWCMIFKNCNLIFFFQMLLTAISGKREAPLYRLLSLCIHTLRTTSSLRRRKCVSRCFSLSCFFPLRKWTSHCVQVVMCHKS